MPPDPNQKIDELLRAYARQRRTDAGAPVEPHPVTRRQLLAEVARTYGQAQVRPVRRGFFNWQSWPRLAQAGLALALLLIVGSFFLPALSKSKSKAQQIARLSEKLEEIPAALARQDANVSDETGADSSVRSKEFFQKPAASPLATVAPIVSPTAPAGPVGSLDSGIGGGGAGGAGTVTVATAPAARSEAFMRRYGSLNRPAGQALGEDKPVAAPGAGRELAKRALTPAEADVAMNALVPQNGFGLALEPGTVVDESRFAYTLDALAGFGESNALGLVTATDVQLRSYAEAGSTTNSPGYVLAPESTGLSLADRGAVVSAGASLVKIKSELAAKDTSAGIAVPALAQNGAVVPADGATVQFVWSYRASAGENEGKKSARPAILESFQLVLQGDQIRLIDADGSVYEGRPPPAVAEREALGRTVAAAAPAFKAGAVDAKLDAVDADQSIVVRVLGTNRTANQRVEFDGRLQMPAQNATASAQSQAGNRPPATQAPEPVRQQSAVGQQLRMGGQLQGVAVVDRTNRIPINAQAAP